MAVQDIQYDGALNFSIRDYSVTLPAGVATVIADLHLPARYGKQTIAFANTGSGSIDTAFELVRNVVDSNNKGDKLIANGPVAPLSFVVKSGTGFAPDGQLVLDSGTGATTWTFPIVAGAECYVTLNLNGAGEFQFVATSSAGTTVHVQTGWAELPFVGGV